ANTQMGSMAYATGNSVAFKGAPDLHTAAHEAAHIVQQRAGAVQLKDGIGAQGDQYEQHADRVADLVVQGKSAEAELDQMAPRRGGDGGVQGKKEIQHTKGGAGKRGIELLQFREEQGHDDAPDVQFKNPTGPKIEGAAGVMQKYTLSGPPIPLGGPFFIKFSGELGAAVEKRVGNEAAGVDDDKEGSASKRKIYEGSITAEIYADLLFFKIGLGVKGSIKLTMDGDKDLKGDGFADLARLIAFRSAGNKIKAVEKVRNNILTRYKKTKGDVDRIMGTSIRKVKSLADAYSGKHGPGMYKMMMEDATGMSQNRGVPGGMALLPPVFTGVENYVRMQIETVGGVAKEEQIKAIRGNAEGAFKKIHKAISKLTNAKGEMKRAAEAGVLKANCDIAKSAYDTQSSTDMREFEAAVAQFKGFKNDPGVGIELAVEVFAKASAAFSDAVSAEGKVGRIAYGLEDKIVTAASPTHPSND
ncbi:MAG: hypothetical protein AAFX99_36305, partial [Myxococcota bacterium]